VYEDAYVSGKEHFGQVAGEPTWLDDIQVNLMEMWPTTVKMVVSGSDRDATINSEDVKFLNTCKNFNTRVGVLREQMGTFYDVFSHCDVCDSF
jgi:hypothetical protein